MPKKIIFDTDLGCDCDDVGALAVLLNLERQGYCKTLAVTHCIGNHWGADFIQRELAWFGYPDTPFGRLHDDHFMNWDGLERFTRPYCEAHPGEFPEPEEAVRLLRRTLAENGGVPDITLCAVGPLHNLGLLLTSGPDDISRKTGVELVRENICEIVLMFGNFAEPEKREFNALCDVVSSRVVVSLSPVPITYSGFEIGVHLLTGAPLPQLSADHPVREGYRVYTQESYLRNSWDPITLYYAVMGTQGMWKHSDPCSVTVQANGSLAVTPGGRDRYLIQTADDQTIIDTLNALMV